MLNKRTRLIRKMKCTIVCSFSIMCLPIACVQAASDVPARKTLAPMPADVRINKTVKTDEKIVKLLQTSKVFEQLASQPLPEGLDKNRMKEAQRYDRWLRKTSRELKQLADQWKSTMSGYNSHNKMPDMQKHFNRQYLMLQNKISHENRQFKAVSNIMKNKHDTAKNSINNLR